MLSVSDFVWRGHVTVFKTHMLIQVIVQVKGYMKDCNHFCSEVTLNLGPGLKGT